MTKWQRLLLYSIVGLMCLIAVMLLLGVTVVWEPSRPAEAGISDTRTVTHFSNLWCEGYLTADDQAAETVTNLEQIDPAGTYQPLTAAGTVTAGITVGSGGDFLYLVNTSAQTIIITVQTAVALAGDFSMGQYDSLFLLCDGTRWVEITRSNN